MLMGVLVPVLVMTLMQQHDAKDELATYGNSIYPELGSGVGVSTGNFAGGTHWMFKFDAGRQALLNYYREPTMSKSILNE
ncbi:MAG: hypothetical protein HKN70_01340 [Gammaproteobacteria bacterium]|nr:hypothetical protein [Gammaproteobacteria bacterium]